MARVAPRHPSLSLDGFSVETISRNVALPLILRYEWLGTLGHATIFVGLFSPQRDLQGVACFGHGPSGPIRDLIGEPALCLERGACVHYAPRNAASFLITHACKLVCRLEGVPLFFAYCDPNAGEYGGIYQACGWAYLGQGLNGVRTDRKRRYAVVAPGDDPDCPENWKTTRALRRSGFYGEGAFRAARAAGWIIGYRAARHVYATHVGRERKAWHKSMRCLPYPAPNPDLKLKHKCLRAAPAEHAADPAA